MHNQTPVRLSELALAMPVYDCCSSTCSNGSRNAFKSNATVRLAGFYCCHPTGRADFNGSK